MLNDKLQFSEDLLELSIREGVFSGTYKAVQSRTCQGCAFYKNYDDGCRARRIDLKCTADFEPRRTSVIWVKNADIQETTPRPHADLIIRWGSDADLRVWSWRYDDWYCNTCPSWDKDIIYAVSTEKPTHIPMKMYIFTLIGKEYPITLPANLSESEVESKIKERVFEITEFSYKEV